MTASHPRYHPSRVSTLLRTYSSPVPTRKWSPSIVAGDLPRGGLVPDWYESKLVLCAQTRIRSLNFSPIALVLQS